MTDYAKLIADEMADYDIVSHGPEWALLGTGSTATFETKAEASRERALYVVRHVLAQLGVRDSFDAEIDAGRCDQPGSPHQLAAIVRRYHQEQTSR